MAHSCKLRIVFRNINDGGITFSKLNIKEQ